MVKRILPLAIAFIFGWLTLIGLLLPQFELSDLLLNWVGFLAAAALLLGVVNLLAVHANRLFRGRNFYSGILVLSMLAVFGLAITDSEQVQLTENALDIAFNQVQVPLEAALASLLAFFLLFAGFRLLRRQRNGWSLLFLLTAALVLFSGVLLTTTLLPTEINSLVAQVHHAITEVFVTAGMRGILIGVALGTMTLSLRILIGLDRPYNK